MLATRIPFQIWELDYHFFSHGYGEDWSEAKELFAIWYLQMQDMNNKMVKVPFYICSGTCLLFLWNEILHKSEELGQQDLLVLLKGVLSNSDGERLLNIYRDVGSGSLLRTYLQAVPTKCRSIRLDFAAFHRLKARQIEEYKLTAANLSIGVV